MQCQRYEATDKAWVFSNQLKDWSRSMFTKKAFAAIAFASLVFSTAASAQNVRFGAGQQGSQNYGVNAALALAIDEKTDLTVTVQAFGGPTAHLPLVNEGELDMAAVVTPDLGDAIRGTGPFKDMAQKNLRVVSALQASPVGLMVKADSGIKTIADLKGKRVAWGIPAQASLQPYIEGALANGGLVADDVTKVPVASVRNGVEALVSGNVDATLFALRGGAVVEANSSTGGIRWLPFDNSAEAVARMTAIAPESYIYEVANGAGIVGAAGAFSTMAYDYVLVSRADFDAAAIKTVAETIRDDVAQIAASNKVLEGMTKESIARSYPSLPMHDAAKGVFGQ